MGEDAAQIRAQERENLRFIIQQWNANRLDLFEISEPDENLDFHGVMRFYFQDSGQKVATKCIRVSSNSTTRHVIETLIEKFRPDMRMLSIPEYTLYEIHEMEDERRIGEEEKPLLVQLNWNKDDREGRFLLRRMDINGLTKLKTLPPVVSTPQPVVTDGNFIRKLSKREKKELKKQEKMRRAVEDTENDNSVAEKLYTELPETSFTRSISNPEAVMRRRRAQKLEKRLQQFRSKDGGPDTGGTLKIYGESLCRDVPYKTLLLSVRDSAAHVVKEMLDKYGLYKEDYNNYCLVKCIVTAEETLDGYQGQIIPKKEYILDDEECPLSILMNHPPSRGSIMFQVRRRPLDHGQRRRKKKPLKGSGIIGSHHYQQTSRHPLQHPELLPFLSELGPDGAELLGGKGHQHQLQLNVTEVGTDRSAHSGGQSLQLFGPHIQPRHCVIAHTDGIVTITPCSRDAETYVNFQRIFETTILQNGAFVRFGRTHSFRFIDPQHEDRMRLHLTPQQPMPPHHHPQQYIDNNRFLQDAKGEQFGSLSGSRFGSRASSIAGSQTSIARPPMRSGSELQLRSPGAHDAWGNYTRFGPPRDPILPAVLEFREDVEDAFLHNIITQLDPTDLQFKLAPTYTLYMAARFRASTHYRPDLTPTERAEKLTDMLTKVSTFVHKVIEIKHRDATALAFWMANASELLHFLKQDRHICGYSLDAQDILAEAVQFAFRKLVEYMQSELSTAMPLFLEDRDDKDEEEGCTAHVLSILTNTMALLRRCRVNAALTIQLFSQLFHYVNMWVFNKVVLDCNRNYCTREWGERIKERLSRIELWAEKLGLELAADCHLAKLSQAALLLIADKSSPDNVSNISSTCFKLNSIQLREMLERYDPALGEPPIPKELVENVVSVAETTADGLAREDGREVKLEEEADLQLPFLLPEDGYSCDILRGVPSGLAEFLDPLQRAQLCRMTPQPTSSGFWTIYMHNHQEALNQRPSTGPRSPSAMSNRSLSIPRGEPEVHTIQLHKSNSGMGLSIVATKGENQDQLGIYIKSVVPGGAADRDGRLQASDQLLSVDGKSLVGISQEEAAQYMVGTGPLVTLEVARQGALYHGLASLLSQPSPQGNRGPQDRRDASTLDLPSHAMQHQQAAQPPHHQKPLQNHPQLHQQISPSQRQPMFSPHQPIAPSNMHPRIQSAKSVPSLTSETVTSSGAKAGHHDVFNPAYSRTSSSTSLSQPQSHQHNYPLRSRSTQNLSEGMPLTLTGRHPSNPTLATEDDRHYQNISFHQGTQDPRMGSQRGGRPPIIPPPSQDRPTSAFMHREDPRNENQMRPSSQQNLRPDLRFNLAVDEARRRDESSRHNGHAVPQASPGSLHSPVGAHPHQSMPSSRGYGGPYPGQPMHPHYSQSVPPPHTSPQGYPPAQQISPQYANSPQGQKNPPPTAPKPNRGSGSHFESEQPLRQPSEIPMAKLPGGPPRPPPPEDGYRDSPPPPPPPTSTHPLLQTGPPTRGLTMKDAAKGPWNKEEKEQYEIRKREAIRRWRDEQITALESLEGRSPPEEERLKTLRLEKEFQRRAEEAERDEDEDPDEEDDEETDEEEIQRPQPNKLHQNLVAPQWPTGGEVRHNGGGPVIEERAKKADEIRRKQQEFEAAKEQEERILREAQRRQEEEEVRRHHHYHHHQQQRHQHHASQRLDSLVGAPTPGQQGGYSNGPLNGIRGSMGEASPLPPERGSSYSIMQHQPTTGAGLGRGRNEPPPVKRVQFSEISSPVEPRVTYDDNANQEVLAVREDPDNFINDAENLLNSNSPIQAADTPGVIGAQEVYRDPRQRRLLEQAQKAASTKSPGPEKLTFREKMKMFAMETGDNDSPKDKVKTSKAQREIDYPA